MSAEAVTPIVYSDSALRPHSVTDSTKSFYLFSGSAILPEATMLTSILYPHYKVYGPYTRKDKRKIVVLACDRHYLRLAYSRFLMQEHLGRVLNVDEEVDHKDEDKTNDNLDNLQVLPRKVHQALTDVGDETCDFECMFCQKHIVLSRKQWTNMLFRRRNGQSAPFCSKRCSGLYGKQFQ